MTNFKISNPVVIKTIVCILHSCIWLLETFYWFGDNNYTEWEELFIAYHPPSYRLPKLTGAYSYGVAGNIFIWHCWSSVKSVTSSTTRFSETCYTPLFKIYNLTTIFAINAL